MAAFLVVPIAHSAGLVERIQLAGLAHMKLARNQWLIAYDGDCDSLAKKLLLVGSETHDPVASALIVEVLSERFCGYAHRQYWDFLNKYKRDRADDRTGCWESQKTQDGTCDVDFDLTESNPQEKRQDEGSQIADDDWGLWNDSDYQMHRQPTKRALDPTEYHTRAEWRAAGWPDSVW